MLFINSTLRFYKAKTLIKMTQLIRECIGRYRPFGKLTFFTRMRSYRVNNNDSYCFLLRLFAAEGPANPYKTAVKVQCLSAVAAKPFPTRGVRCAYLDLVYWWRRKMT